jgi:osmotically-inducible protein OsmY
MYTSQSELIVQAQDALKNSALQFLKQLSVDDVDGRLVITGTVETYYQKQQAQEIIRGVAGGMQVENEVLVKAF